MNIIDSIPDANIATKIKNIIQSSLKLEYGSLKKSKIAQPRAITTAEQKTKANINIIVGFSSPITIRT